MFAAPWWSAILLVYGAFIYIGVAKIGASAALVALVFGVLALAFVIGSWLGYKRLHL